MKAMPREHLAQARQVHMVGIGGIGVSALAELLLARGAVVTGTDRQASQRLEDLRRLGVDVRVGDTPELVTSADLLVYTSAATADHPERKAAEAAGIPQFARGAALAAVVAERRGIGVAGAHGKTTTTAMLTGLLEACGTNPGAAVGGIVEGWGSPVRTGDGEFFAVEADESDKSFLALDLAVALALNIDQDHLENYRDFDELLESYRRYLEGAREVAVVFLDDPFLRKIANTWSGDRAKLITVSACGEADLEVRELTRNAGAVQFQALWKGEDLGLVELPRPGFHDATNLACALAAGLFLGLDPTQLKLGATSFQGVARRFTLRGVAAEVEVRDDYAHMPVEVAASLEAARGWHPAGRVIAVFQPHLFTRTQAHAKAFGEALEQADLAFVLPIYKAREQPLKGVDASLITRGRADHVRLLDVTDLAEVATHIESDLQPGDLVLTMGAGSITHLGNLLLEARWRRLLRERMPALEVEYAQDESLARFNSWHCGGPALLVARAEDEAQLAALMQVLSELQLPFKTLGGGTNILVSERGYRGAILRLGAAFEGFNIESEDGPQVTFRAGAAITTGKLFRRLQKAGIGGFEFFHHVPGTLGGALVNNSSAYGQDLIGKLLEFRIMETPGKVRWLGAEARQAGYRHTCYKGKEGLAILEARFRADRAPPDAILTEARRQATLRNRSQPGGKGSVGCTFENPPGQSAGRLIDQAGLKGLRRGGAQVSERHGNFILNVDQATTTDIVGLAEEVRREVRNRFGVDLKFEVERIGAF
jgi:UDP-N-acetylmuramate--alanine ligase